MEYYLLYMNEHIFKNCHFRIKKAILLASSALQRRTADECRAVHAIFHSNLYDLDFVHVTRKFILIISLNLFITTQPQL